MTNGSFADDDVLSKMWPPLLSWMTYDHFPQH